VSKRLAICSKQKTYITFLAEHISHRKDLLIQINLCFSLQKLKELEEKYPIDIVLLDEKISYKERQKIKGSVRFVLTSQHCKDLGTDEQEIYQYQPAKKIIEQIAVGCIEETDIFRSYYGNKKKEIIGVYSPLHRIGKTEFSLALGKELGKTKEVLYINLEEYGYLSGIMERDTGTLADILYHVKQEVTNLNVYLSEAVIQTDSVDILAPLPISADVKEVPLEDWKILFSRIIRESMYDVIIIDFSESIQGLLELLCYCDTLYVPTINNHIANEKMRKFQDNMKILGYQKGILEKMTKINMQRDKTICVREILEKQVNDRS
jgi:ATPases involved in chromosome partitioning